MTMRPSRSVRSLFLASMAACAACGLQDTTPVKPAADVGSPPGAFREQPKGPEYVGPQLAITVNLVVQRKRGHMLLNVCPDQFLTRGAINQHQVVINIYECPANLKNSVARIITHYKYLWKAPCPFFNMEAHLCQLSPFLFTLFASVALSSACTGGTSVLP